MPESPLLRLLERKSGVILYMGLDGNLYTIDQTGGNQTAITTDSQPDLDDPDYKGYLQFAWAPNGEKLAYSGFNRNKSFIITADVDGSNPVEAYSSEDEIPIYLYWSPNSQSLSILTNQIGSNQLTLRLVAANGSQAPQLLANGQPLFWAWEPSEPFRALAHIGSAGESRLAMITPDSARASDWTLAPATFQAPAWSPDGFRLLIGVNDRSDQNQLAIVSPQGRIQEYVATFKETESVAFGWSPDGQYVSYIISDRARGQALGRLVVQKVSQPDEAILIEDNFVTAYFWAPNSKKLVYFTVELAASDPDSPNPDEPSLAMGLYSLDIKSGASKNLLYFLPTRQFLEVLQFFDQYQHSATIWSPDSENVVVSALAPDGEGAAIVVVPASGNIEIRPLVEGLLGFWSWK